MDDIRRSREYNVVVVPVDIVSGERMNCFVLLLKHLH